MPTATPSDIIGLPGLTKIQVSLPKHRDWHTAACNLRAVASTRGLLFVCGLIFTDVHLAVLKVDVKLLSLTGYTLEIECDLCEI
jgi:hypothetical protein